MLAPEATLSVPTVVSRWLMLSPTLCPAFRRSALALMSASASLAPPTSASASRMRPAVAVMLTWPSVSSMSPTVTSVPASTRAVALAPVLTKALLALWVIAPAACTSMLPLPAAVLLVRRSAPALNTTLAPDSKLMLPLVLRTSALAVISPAPSVCTSTLPLPWATMACPSASTPSFNVMPPVVLRSTIAPLAPLLMSLWLASVTVSVAPDAVNSVTLTLTLPTVTPSASVMKTAP